MLISAPASLGILVSQQLVSVVALDQAPQNRSAAGKRQKTGSKRKNIGECSEPSGQPLRSLRSPMFFFAHTNFFFFSLYGARSQPCPSPRLKSQAMSVDISSPVFTLTKWQEGRSRWAVSQKRKCVLWGLGRKKKEARGGPQVLAGTAWSAFSLFPLSPARLLLFLLGHPASGSLCGEESCDFVIRE